ncbi:hypothetical protein EPYR_02847 [Erwinia pyrifoliae DSM 12163]|nr:hypothetical protein EPYR_02847 [Erwinia pyrifoliae DSM 12163]
MIGRLAKNLKKCLKINFLDKFRIGDKVISDRHSL